MPLLLILVCLPLIEIALFVMIGGEIGLWPTLALVIASSLAGLLVMRGQGTRALIRLNESMEKGGDPTGPLAHGALIMIAGVLLLVPGFFTSSWGVLLLIPPIRRWMIGRGAGVMSVRAARFGRGGQVPRGAGTVHPGQPRPGQPRPGQTRTGQTPPGTARPTRPSQQGAIDAEYEVVEDGSDAENGGAPRHGGSGWTRPH